MTFQTTPRLPISELLIVELLDDALQGIALIL